MLRDIAGVQLWGRRGVVNSLHRSGIDSRVIAVDRAEKVTKIIAAVVHKAPRPARHPRRGTTAKGNSNETTAMTGMRPNA